MAPKPHLTPEERKELRALKKAEKKQKRQEKKKQLKRELLTREINYGAVTLKRQEKTWRQLLIGLKVPEMRKDLEFAWHHFERLVDCKDFAISLLLDELDKANGQYFLNMKTHSEHIDQLLQMFADQVQQLQQDYSNQAEELEKEHQFNADQLEAGSSEEENYLKTVLYILQLEMKEVKRTRHAEYFSKLEEQDSKQHQLVQRMKGILEQLHLQVWTDTVQFLQRHQNSIKERKKIHLEMKSEDDKLQLLIRNQLEHIRSSHNTIRSLKVKEAELEKFLGRHVADLQSEFDFFTFAFNSLKTKLTKDRRLDFQKLNCLTIHYNEVIAYMESLEAKGKHILHVGSVCRKLETVKEKILPFPANFVNEMSKPSVSEVSEYMEALELFWQRVGRADAARYGVNEEREFLITENEILKRRLHQYCQCLKCPDFQPFQTTSRPCRTITEGVLELKKYNKHGVCQTQFAKDESEPTSTLDSVSWNDASSPFKSVYAISLALSMKSDISQFQRYCEKAIGQLTAESLEAFKETKDDVARIQVMYPLAQQIPLDPGGCSKNFQEAEQLKSAGNRAFALKDYSEAIQSYNQAIICCPQQTIEDRQLLTILVSNRSACNFELGNIRKVLDDLDYIGEIGDYPSHLCYKLWLRKGKCYSALQNKKLAGEAFNEALKCLEQSGLTEEALQTKAHEIQRAQTGQAKLQAPKSQLELIAAFPEERFVGGEEFPAAHPKITVSQDSIQGRYAKAVGDIETGTILVEETAFGAVVDKEHALKNCQNCLASVELPIACPQCSEVIFCSTHCSRMAFKSFHGVECGMQRQLFQCGASVNCLLALRLISQKPLRFFLDKRSKLQDFMRDSCKKSAPYKKVYRSNDYDNVFFLCRNESLRKKEELVAYACMSIYLLRLLKQGFYFGESTAEAPTTNELFVGGLLLRHLQILQFNAHEISQLQNRSSGFEAACIGAGLYPTLALFNHSCDPSLVRYNVRNKIIARAIRPIKAEDIIYENYGPLYSAADLQQRLEELKKNYWFECMCQPCTQLWPTVRDMRENELRIPCRNDQCPYVFLVKGDDDPFLTCPYCENVTGLLPNLRGLMKLEEILPEAEHKLGAAHFEVALRKFAEALDVLFQFSSPPHPEIIKVQQRMRDCMVHFGNKAFDYKPHIMQ
ncbi:hypothetical protein YQE_07129, partial [Dendroctonus ponderosae]